MRAMPMPHGWYSPLRSFYSSACSSSCSAVAPPGEMTGDTIEGTRLGDMLEMGLRWVMPSLRRTTGGAEGGIKRSGARME